MTRHHRFRSLITVALAAIVCVGWMVAYAQPPEGRDSPPPPREGPPRDGPPSRDGVSPGERRPPSEGRPSPERFVERAMSFDTDGDGKLDRAELEKFAGEFMQRLQGGIGGRGPRPGRPPDGGPRDAPGFKEGGDRPVRPRRPR